MNNIPLQANLFILIITVAVSLISFSNRSLFHKLKFNPSQIKNGEWYRLFTGALVHADFIHLAFNMLALYFAGEVAEEFFQLVIGNNLYGSLAYTAFYIIAIPMSSLFSYEKHKNDPWYNAVGASGAVSAVLFCFILLMPTQMIYVYFIRMPSFIFGIGYLALSWFMGRRGTDNIGHDAHFFGGLFGILVTLIIRPVTAIEFFDAITNYF